MTAHFGTSSIKLVRAQAPATSIAAAMEVNTAALEQLVFDAIASFGEAGCISDEVRALYPEYPYSSITARYRALLDKELIEVIGTRAGASGKQQRIMRKTQGQPMAAIPKPMNTTAEAIVRWWDQRDQSPRPHLGCSEVGRECKRALWYSFRWASERRFEGRMLRLFNTGQLAEQRFLDELRAIGAEVYDTDPDTKQQHRFVGYKGHLAGSCDAIGRGLPESPKTWAVIEFKTHGEKSFKELQGKGVKLAKPEHWAQMQLYMGFAELDRALYLAVNKNTDELHSEWIHFDAQAFADLNAKAAQVIDADVPPEGISTDPAWWQCKFCDHHAICHGDKVPLKSCRTCVHATPVDNGQWHCDNQARRLPEAEQRLSCRQHLYIPPLLTWAEPIDAGDGWIKYADRSTQHVFANVTPDADVSEESMSTDVVSCMTSDELAAGARPFIGDPFVNDMKATFGAKVVKVELTDADIPF